MTAPPTPDVVLRLCAAPDPWFPSDYARATGTDRDALDEPLARLRLGGLVRIGGWEAGKGQWYAATDAGRAALADPRVLASLKNGVPVPPPPVTAPSPRAGRRTAWDRGEAVRAAFVPSGRLTPGVYAVILAQIVVFALGLSLAIHRHASLAKFLSDGVEGQKMPPSPVTVLALWPPMLARGEWWRLLTYALVHFGALHILMNLYGHFALGPIVERMFGSARFLILYLLSALGGGVAAALLSPPEALTAGSSGALCGLIGGFAAFVLLNRRHLGGELFDASRRWLGNTLVLLVLFSLMPGVSWQGHLGGFVGGMVAGVLLVYHRFGTAEQRWAALLGIVLLPLAGVAPLVERHILQFPRSAPDERTAFAEQVVPVVERIRARVTTVGDDVVDPLRYQAANSRDENAVKHARAELTALGRDEQVAQLQIAHAGPYRAAALQEAQRAALKYVSDQMQVTQALDTCFARGPQWAIASDKSELDETRLQGLLNQALESDLRWRHLSRAAQARP